MKKGKKLCSDAFSAWSAFDPQASEMCRDIIEATRCLYEEIIPEATRMLESSKPAAEYCDFVQSLAGLILPSAHIASAYIPCTLAEGENFTYHKAVELLDQFVMDITPNLHALGCNIRHLVRKFWPILDETVF